MTLPSVSHSPASSGCLRVEGSWFRDETGRKVLLRGVTYGPFKPDQNGKPWPNEGQLRADFSHIQAMGFDSVRVYEPPTDAVLRACADHHLRLVCGIPWTQHVDFITNASIADDARQRIREESRRLSKHACVTAILVGNEIEKTLVRWMGPERVLTFVESLIAEAKEAAPGKLVSYAGYPSTEYLIPRNADFIAFNVFLEERELFLRYVQHLQVLAAGKPVVITEFGLDSKTHGEARQAEAFRWYREVCELQSITGSFWFSYTDEWHRGGQEVTGWEFGLVQRDRSVKAALTKEACDSGLHSTSTPGAAAHFPAPGLAAAPTISVIICTLNGSATLRSCLEALGKQSHPAYEVMVIDDGSTDATPEIARSFPYVRYERREHAGLSAARNTGMELARSELLAYTDDDCIPDEDWLLNVSRAFDDPRCVAAGGPNLPPPPRDGTEACVAVAPGAPSHVLLDDFEAEHLPGCNLVIRKASLRALDGFREEFTSAGDDVDICWRLQAHGGRLRFVPGAVVWHHRRRTICTYLRQQRGYGRAEAMLIRRYAHRFAWLGGARWRGMIYGDTPPHLLHTGAMIRFGRFGNALFQTVYAPSTPSTWDWMTGLPWLALALLLFPLSLLWSNAWLIGASMLLLMFTAAWRRTRVLPEDGLKVASRHIPLLCLLCLLQPIIRDWGRLSGMIRLNAWPKGRAVWPWPWRYARPVLLSPQEHWWRESFWSEEGIGRESLLHAMRHLAPQHGLIWSDADESSVCDATLTSVHGFRSMAIATVTEFHEGGRCLTRVASGGKHPFWIDATLCALGCLILMWQAQQEAALWWLMVIALLIAGWWLRDALKTRAAVRGLIYAAAERCNLWRGERAEDLAGSEPRQGVLASASRSAEL